MVQRILKHWFVAITPGESGTHFFTVRSKVQPTREERVLCIPNITHASARRLSALLGCQWSA